MAILRDRDKEHPCNIDGPRNVDYTTDYDLSNLYLAGQMRLCPVTKGGWFDFHGYLDRDP